MLSPFHENKCGVNRQIQKNITKQFSLKTKNSLSVKNESSYTQEDTEMQWGKVNPSLHTTAVFHGSAPEKYRSKCVVIPIVTSSNFLMEGAGTTGITGTDADQFEYASYGNPTRNHLERQFLKLENSKHALIFGSGMAAISAVLLTLKQGDHILSISPIYGGTSELMDEMKQYGISVDYVYNTTTANIMRHVKKHTKMIYLESPGNPTLHLVDIEEIAEAAHKIRGDILVVVDNTFLTPVFQRPLELGADICVYSCSKYIGGHADIIMGAVTTNSNILYENIHKLQKMMGGVPSSFDCYLAIRSLKTLPLRMEKHCSNALKVAKFLETHPNVEKVIHPGLESNPQKWLALKQQSGHSGMVAFYIKGGFKESATFLESIKVIRKAPSLGADISLASIPGRMSHTHLTEKERAIFGITDNLIRLSVGLEGAEDIMKDLNQALWN